jgi:hypothetical protein
MSGALGITGVTYVLIAIAVFGTLTVAQVVQYGPTAIAEAARPEPDPTHVVPFHARTDRALRPVDSASTCQEYPRHVTFGPLAGHKRELDLEHRQARSRVGKRFA